LVIAVLSDTVGFLVALLPPLQLLVDAITAALLFTALGFRWPLVSVLAMEVVPGLQVFPLWTLVVVVLAANERTTTPVAVDVVGVASSGEASNKPNIHE
jgi:hypothetical protein